MTDYIELKRLAESLPQLPWSYEANGFILAWDGTERSRCENVGGFYYVCEGVSNFREYLLALEPATVLALIAENERLRENPHIRSIRSLRGDCADLIAERDQLRAEIAGLKTGYEAYERVNAELKGEVELLRSLLGQSALAATTLRTDAEAYANHSGFNRGFVDFIRSISGVEVGHGYGSSKYPQQADVVAALGQGERP